MGYKGHKYVCLDCLFTKKDLLEYSIFQNGDGKNSPKNVNLYLRKPYTFKASFDVVGVSCVVIQRLYGIAETHVTAEFGQKVIYRADSRLIFYHYRIPVSFGSECRLQPF